MKSVQKLLALILAFVFTFTAASVWPDAAAEDNVSTANRYNVVLVMDKSGSLRDTDGVGTDPDGLRFDAMKLFLGLLTETGNNVGTIAFDEAIRYDSGLKAVDSLDDKKELVQAVEALGTSYDTDIGLAVLRAVETLSGMKDRNGLPCAILLLTDGMTDFSGNPYSWLLYDRSEAAAQKALQIAQEEGITIHGILLNVDGRAQNGEDEIRFYTDGTRGQIQTVASPEDLTAAFARFYSIINKTEYNNANKVVFSDQGETETVFSVPAFGTEEVNIVIEHGNALSRLESIRVTAPDGSDYPIDAHMLEASRFQLVKIPEPVSGQWRVALRGTPGDSVDVCMIYNASMNIALSSDADRERGEVLKPILFHAVVTDTDVNIDEVTLKDIPGELVIKDLSTGETTRYPMDVSADGYSLALTFDKGGEYEVTASVGLKDFDVRSDSVVLKIDVPQPFAKQSLISDYRSSGTIRDNAWELSLDSLFEDPKGTALSYMLSDSLGGAAEIRDGVLRVKLNELDENAAFTVTATDAYGLTAILPVELTVSHPAAKLDGVKDYSDLGSIRDRIWEIPLADLFDDSIGDGLRYSLSDDLGGALSIENDVLRAKLDELGEKASFSVIAADPYGLTTALPFELTVSRPVARSGGITDVFGVGNVQDRIWEVRLSDLFDDPAGTGLSYALSDDFGDAITIDNGVLRAKLDELGETASFAVTASDSYGFSSVLPFEFTVPHPTARPGGVKDISAVGTVHDKIWEVRLAELFEDAAGAGLSYALSDDLGGAAEIENGVLRVKLAELGEKAAFTVTATDSYGFSAELPFAFNVFRPAPKLDSVNDLSGIGSVQNKIWEVPLANLFDDPTGAGLSYALSDDLGGAAEIENGVLRVKLDQIDKTASFIVIAEDLYGLSSELPVALTLPSPQTTISEISDLSEGQIRNNVWELDLDKLFEDAQQGSLTYTLSDDLNGAASIENGILSADLEKLPENASFFVTAENACGQAAELPINLAVAFPAARLDQQADLLEKGQFSEDGWALDLRTVFEDPAGSKLSYAVSNAPDGALTLENDVLKVRPEGAESISFTVTATDENGLSTSLPVELSFPSPAVRLDSVSDVVGSGQIKGNSWELDLNGLFEDPKGTALRYTLSDDCGGTVSIEDGILTVRPEGTESVSFTVTATDPLGLKAALPFELRFPTPIAKTDGVSETVKTGLFQKGTWEKELHGLFEDPKGTALAYTLSDDYAGRLKIEGETLIADCRGIGEADFTVKATDALGLSAEIPFRLAEKDMTWIILCSLLPATLVPVIMYFFLRRRHRSK